MKSQGIAAILGKAVAGLRKRHTHLLAVAANERSICHHLANEIEVVWRDQVGEHWDVDCEYNRNHHDPKTIPDDPEELGSGEPRVTDVDARTVYPDIIVHRRGTAQNYLAVEVKKAGSPIPLRYDRTKLTGYLAAMGYKYVALVQLPVGPSHLSDDPLIVVSDDDGMLPAFDRRQES